MMAMMRTVRILVWGVGALAAVVLSAAAVMAWLINPNDYKPQIVAAVRRATGRELELTGDLRLAVIPWVGLQVGAASLGNPPGFPNQPRLSFRHATLGLKLLPLLVRRFEVGHVEIDDLEVRFPAQSDAVPAAATVPDVAVMPGIAPMSGVGVAPVLASVRLRNATILYRDLTIGSVDLETGPIVVGEPVPLTVKFAVARGSMQATVDARVDVRFTPASRQLTLAALNLISVVTSSSSPRPVRWSASVPTVDIDLRKQSANAPVVNLTIAGALVSGHVSGAHILEAPRIAGSLTLEPLVLQEYLPRVGVVLPATRDPKALSLLTATAGFAYDSDTLRFEPLRATLDDTHLTGGFASINLATRALAFNCAVDQVDLARYLAPPGQVSRASAPPGAPAPATVVSPALLEANGTLTVGAVHLQPMEFADVRVTLADHERVLHIFPLTATLDGGRYSGDITVDGRSAVPTLSLDEHLTGIDMAKLSAAGSTRAHVSGRGNMNLKATGHGVGETPILKSLEGHLDVEVSDGALEGFDLDHTLRQAESLFGSHAAAAADTRRTPFNRFKFSAAISEGVATTQDLMLDSIAIKITGQGSVTLATQALDLQLIADVRKSLAGLPLALPVRVTGSLSDPTVRPDVAGLLKGRFDKLKSLFGRP